jgi:sugar lactone lactonase YvrE
MIRSMSGSAEVEAPFGERDYLGEAPHWNVDAGELLRVDIHAGLVHSIDPTTGLQCTMEVGPPVSFAIPRVHGGFVFGVQHGLLLQDPDGTRRYAAEVETDQTENRFNEGKCDPAGRLWAGTMSTVRRTGVASLYRLGSDGEFARILTGLTISNGLGWSLGHDAMYVIDSTTQQVDVFDYDNGTGEIANRRLFVSVDRDAGLPDGMTIDSEGGVWVCLFGGGAVHRYAPDGELDLVVPLPVSNPTSPVFAGPHLSDLYITTARHRLTAAQLAQQPLAGAVLRLRPGVTGLAPTRFAG